MQEIKVHLNPSKQFVALILFVWSGSVGITFYLQIPVYAKIFLLCAVCSYGLFILRKYGLLRDKHSVIELGFYADGWLIQTRSQRFLAELAGDSTVTTRVSVLRFVAKGLRFKQSCVIWRDSVADDNQYRRLMVIGRWVKLNQHKK